jgi:dihydropyrimidinase
VSVGSDHCAYQIDAKRVAVDDHRHVPAGAPGIEARTPMLFSEAVRRQGLVQYAHQTATRAARALGMPSKGSIELGKDADLVLWDAGTRWSGQEAVQASTASFSLYDQTVGTGRPREVWVRGAQVVRDGLFIGEPQSGRFLARRARSVGVPSPAPVAV